MRVHLRRRLPLLAVVVAVAGCAPANDAREAAPRTVTAAPAPAPAPWYARSRSLDLTGDARPDSVHLEAVGARTDSLQVTLTFHVGGMQRHRETWGSGYQLALVDSAARTGARADALLRAKLDSVLASVVVQRLDSPGVRLMAEDRAILDTIAPRPTHRVTFSYGFETTVQLAWDAPRERFVRLFSCC